MSVLFAVVMALGILVHLACAVAILVPCLAGLAFITWLLTGGMYE